jgi:hypothetical protein
LFLAEGTAGSFAARLRTRCEHLCSSAEGVGFEPTRTRQRLAVFKIASATTPSAALTCTVDDLLIKQAHGHPVHIPRALLGGSVAASVAAHDPAAKKVPLRRQGSPWPGHLDGVSPRLCLAAQARWCRPWVSATMAGALDRQDGGVGVFRRLVRSGWGSDRCVDMHAVPLNAWRVVPKWSPGRGTVRERVSPRL